MGVRTGALIASAGLALACGIGVSPTASLPRAAAQDNPTIKNLVPQSAAMTIHAKIVSIDPAARQIVLQGRSGNVVTVNAGPLVRLDMLKAGDTVNAKYYRSIAFELSRPQSGNGVPQNGDEVSQISAQPVQAPGGVGVRLTKVSGLVVGIDMAAQSLELVNPAGGGIYTVEVTDPARVALLSQVKVGDTITALVSQALAVSIEPAPQSWF